MTLDSLMPSHASVLAWRSIGYSLGRTSSFARRGFFPALGKHDGSVLLAFFFNLDSGETLLCR
jgi:hypothetical protein